MITIIQPIRVIKKAVSTSQVIFKPQPRAKMEAPTAITRSPVPKVTRDTLFLHHAGAVGKMFDQGNKVIDSLPHPRFGRLLANSGGFLFSGFLSALGALVVQSMVLEVISPRER